MSSVLVRGEALTNPVRGEGLEPPRLTPGAHP